LVVSEVRELWKIENWLLLGFLVVLIIVNLNETLSNEVHFLDITLVANNSLPWSVDSAVHSNNQLVSETSLTLLKEMVERSLELLEDSGILDQISLHLWSNLLVELELLNNQVEIVKESLFNVLSDIIV
jgi:hypothetical protein